MSKNRNRSGNKRDNLEVKGQLDNKNFKQNPNWYFKDAVQADVLSRIQMNAFGAITKIGGNVQPTVCALYANPCPGVTPYDLQKEPEFGAKGINRAAQKLWYILTCKSGRAAGYTKADVAILLLGMGSMIETYEFIRRAFGIAYTYNQRNRALPGMLYQAMCVDMDDYQKNAAPYLKRMNSLMAIMNQLPMPGNIAWFAKCQDIYQNIYMDYPSEMAQLFIVSPSTTWVVEENDGFIGGSYLRTIDMCIQHADSEVDNPILLGNSKTGHIVDVDGHSYGIISRKSKSDRVRKLSDYIDVFEEQVNNLLFSSTFSQIYSDLLRAFDNGTLSRWTFDYIDEKYIVSPVFDDNRLWMFHNCVVASGLVTISRHDWQAKWGNDLEQLPAYGYIFQYGTPCNDVYQWAEDDVVLYNPAITIATGQNYNTDPRVFNIPNMVVDFPNDAPRVEERIEFTRYQFVPRKDIAEYPLNPTTQGMTKFGTAFNLLLPDHWFELCEIYRGENDSVMPFTEYPYSDNERIYQIYDSQSKNLPEVYSKFHHMPLIQTGTLSSTDYKPGDVIGELNSWTLLPQQWYADINDMIYVDLFDLR